MTSQVNATGDNRFATNLVEIDMRIESTRISAIVDRIRKFLIRRAQLLGRRVVERLPICTRLANRTTDAC